jgi:hypothetical protein
MLGIPGGPLAMALTAVLTYPLQVHLARKHGAWDKLHDGVMALVAALLIAAVLMIHHAALGAMLGA